MYPYTFTRARKGGLHIFTISRAYTRHTAAETSFDTRVRPRDTLFDIIPRDHAEY